MLWIETLASVVTAIAVAGAAWAAVRGLNTWRHQLVTTKKSELAEATLAMFYEARDHIAGARSPMGFVGEGASRPREARDEYEAEHQVRYRDSLYAPIERLHGQAEFWGRFLASRYRFMALFGNKAAESYDVVWRVRTRVLGAARMLIQTHGREGGSRESLQRQHERRERWESDIWQGLPNDELTQQIEEAVSAMEQACRPAIQGQLV